MCQDVCVQKACQKWLFLLQQPLLLLLFHDEFSQSCINTHCGPNCLNAHASKTLPHQPLLLIVYQTRDELGVRLLAADCRAVGAVEYFVADLQVTDRVSQGAPTRLLVSHIKCKGCHLVSAKAESVSEAS